MTFQVNDQVVYPACGIVRIVGLVTQTFFKTEARLYYEVAIDKSTVWVPVSDGPASGLRPLTPKAELARCRELLKSRPAALTADPRQRRLELLERLRIGSFQDLCHIVRDLAAQSWRKPLSEADASALRKARAGLSREWAAVTGVSAAQAIEEIDALLLEAKQAHRA
jgi:RNA polymerase-interacting CarD/CdnL/TRCF family regulator